MLKWRNLLLVVLGLFLLAGAGVALAQDEEPIPPFFTDGRLNGYDLAAPVTVYYTHETVSGAKWGEFNEVVSGVELWRVNAEGIGQKILKLSNEEINTAVTRGNMVFESDVEGFDLHVGDNGWLWVSCPGTCPGTVYTFQWDDNGRILNVPY
ncbi:MAG: hypothetical protein IH587_01910 [Anaerolineae bacterium]|nr:hypothetical protein [Anaerolineae bacterium]